MSKRTQDQISEDVPEGFKILPGDNRTVVFAKYVKLIVDKIKVSKVYAHEANDKVNVYVHEDDLTPLEVVWINEVDESLKKYAEENNYKHCPLKDPESKLIKFTPLRKGYTTPDGVPVRKGDTPFSKRKKSEMREYPHRMTGTFMLSSVYKYKPPNKDDTYYGVNLIVPNNAKCCKIERIIFDTSKKNETQGDENKENETQQEE